MYLLSKLLLIFIGEGTLRVRDADCKGGMDLLERLPILNVCLFICTIAAFTQAVYPNLGAVRRQAYMDGKLTLEDGVVQLDFLLLFSVA